MAGLPAGPDTFFSVGPAELAKPECFAIKRGEGSVRVDPRHHALREVLSSPFPLLQLGELVLTEPDYGLSSRAVARTSENDPRYIRITDFGEDGIEPGHEYLTADPIELNYGLDKHDVLFARSGATVGKTYLHEDISEPAIFAGYCIRFRFDSSKVSPRFVYWWSKTAAYSRWVEAIQRPSGQPNINKEEFKSCRVPLPPSAEQERLVAAMDNARAERKRKLAEAEALLAGLDDFVLEVLGLEAPAQDSRSVFAIVGSQSVLQRSDPHFHSPEFTRVQELLSQTRCESLGSIVVFSKEIWKPQDHQQQTFRYIEISMVDSKTGQAFWNDVPVDEAPSRARMKIQTGDIIVSLTRPHHGSIAQLNTEFDGCVASTGFAVIREVADHVRRDYLWCILRTRICLDQMLQRASGGNYPAIIEPELANVVVPIPDNKVQEYIASEAIRRHEESRRLRAEAEDGWQEAKRWFEKQLLEQQYSVR